ncbi:Uncharacterised protein [Bordetella pertussis]|nr:Uncharacterised protein [Bordetella pertussis]
MRQWKNTTSPACSSGQTARPIHSWFCGRSSRKNFRASYCSGMNDAVCEPGTKYSPPLSARSSPSASQQDTRSSSLNDQ